MVKMVKSAQGQEVDWDLLKIQTQVNNNVAEPVDVVDQAAAAARRQQRARMEAARKLLDKAQKEVLVTATKSETTKKSKHAGTDQG